MEEVTGVYDTVLRWSLVQPSTVKIPTSRRGREKWGTRVRLG
jgi:hypothetical protein